MALVLYGWYQPWAGCPEGYEKVTEQASNQHSSVVSPFIPYSRFLLDFLPWLPSVMDCDVEVVSQINPWLPRLFLVIVFLITVKANWDNIICSFVYITIEKKSGYIITHTRLGNCCYGSCFSGTGTLWACPIYS